MKITKVIIEILHKGSLTMEEKEVKLYEKQIREKPKIEKEKKLLNSVKFIKKLPLTVKGIVLIIIAVSLIFIGTRLPSSPLDTEETIIDFGFKDVGKLVTQEWYGRILEDSSKDRKLFNIISIPFTESRLIFSTDVEILAGVDFEDIEYKILNEKEKVIITLPHSEVYKSYEVQNSFKSYLDDESWFTNINSTEQQELKDKIVEKGENQAIKSGLLDKADKNAKSIIKNMIKGNEITKDFEVEFRYKKKEKENG